MKLIKTIFLLTVISLLIILVGCGTDTETGTDAGTGTSDSLVQFATCLTENGAEMYGAEWCGHCNAQKEMFGAAFEKVNYIECTVEQKRCMDAGIQGYPTWKFADGSASSGRQQFTLLAQKTGCSLP